MRVRRKENEAKKSQQELYVMRGRCRDVQNTRGERSTRNTDKPTTHKNVSIGVDAARKTERERGKGRKREPAGGWGEKR